MHTLTVYIYKPEQEAKDKKQKSMPNVINSSEAAEDILK